MFDRCNNDPIKDGNATAKGGGDLGTRQSLSDVGQTIAEKFGLEIADGVSFE